MEITVGIDVSKDRLDVYVHPSGERLAVDNEASRCWWRGCTPVAPMASDTGGLEKLAVGALAAARLPVLVLNPAQVRHYARAEGKRAKTDRIDAAVIARFLAATKPEPRPLADAETVLLGELMARRRQLVGVTVARNAMLSRGGRNPSASPVSSRR